MFLHVTIYLFLGVMIQGGTESERKTYNFDATCLRPQLRKSMREKKAFHLRYVPPILRLEPMEYVYPELNDTANQNRQL